MKNSSLQSTGFTFKKRTKSGKLKTFPAISWNKPWLRGTKRRHEGKKTYIYTDFNAFYLQTCPGWAAGEAVNYQPHFVPLCLALQSICFPLWVNFTRVRFKVQMESEFACLFCSRVQMSFHFCPRQADKQGIHLTLWTEVFLIFRMNCCFPLSVSPRTFLSLINPNTLQCLVALSQEGKCFRSLDILPK